MIDFIKTKEQLGVAFEIRKSFHDPNEMKDRLNNVFGVNEPLGDWVEFFKYAKMFDKIFVLDKNYNDKLNINSQISKTKNNVVKAQTNRVITHTARAEYLGDIVKDFISKNKSITPVKWNKTKIKDDKMTYVFLSDIHYRDSNDNEIIKNTFKDIYKRVNGDIHLVIMGDIVQGNMRISDVLNGDIDIIQQVLEFSKVLIENIDSKQIKKVSILKGNHDEIRLSSMNGNYGVTNPNLCYVCNEIINARFNGMSSVYDELDITSGGTQFHLLHGHQFKGMKHLQEYYKNHKGFVIHGHWHTYYLKDNVIGLPKLCSANDYEKSLGINDDSIGYFILSNGFTQQINM